MNPESLKSPPRPDIQHGEPVPNFEPDQLAKAPYSIVPTACQYCVVGCGYEAHLWQPGLGKDDTPVDRIKLEQGLSVSPAMTEHVMVDGERRIAALLPDPKCPTNKGNHSPRGGTMGRDLVSLPRRNSEGAMRVLDSVRERITTPYARIRVDGKEKFVPISPAQAATIVAELIKTATDAQLKKTSDGKPFLHFVRPGGLGVKIFEYQYLENTYAATKLFFQLIGTPNVAFHDRPSVASNTQGFDDSGIDPHGYAYADIWDSDVIFLAGVNPYESQSVFFMQQMTGKRIVVLDPRRTITADYAEKTGGLHLQPTVLGADVAVINALCRYIVEQRDQDPVGWGASRLPRNLIAEQAHLDFVRKEVAGGKAPAERGPDKARRALYQLGLAEFIAFIKTQPSDIPTTPESPDTCLAEAERLSGIPKDKLRLAAEWLSGPVAAGEEGHFKPAATRKVSLIFEKGLIWGYSYHSTAAMANLGLLLGSVLRPADTLLPVPADPNDTSVRRDPLDHKKPDPAPLGVCGRAGGHQKGWAEVRYKVKDPKGDEFDAGYPFMNARDEFVVPANANLPQGTRIRTHHYFDPHLVGTAVAPRHHQAAPQQAEPEIRLLWIIGSNASGQMADAQAKWEKVRNRRGDNLLASVEAALDVFKARIASGGLVVVQQDIYPNPTTNHADLVLAVAGWGEEDFTRYTGERRLRLYGRFQDSPLDSVSGEHRCQPDWRIFQSVAQKLLASVGSAHGLPQKEEGGQTVGYSPVAPLGAEGFQWADSSEVFRELCLRSNRASLLGALAELGHRWLRQRGTSGILLPARTSAPGAEPVDSPRTDVSKRWSYKDASGQEMKYGPYAFIRADWNDLVGNFTEDRARRAVKTAFDPTSDEFYICNGRINELWNSLFTHIRNETIRQRYPDDMPGTILEIAESDAEPLDIEDGDVVEITGPKQGKFKAVAIRQRPIPDGVDATKSCVVLPSGTVFVYFSYPARTGTLADFPYRTFIHDGYVNNVSSAYVDPMNPIAAVKFARGRIQPIRSSNGEKVNYFRTRDPSRYVGPSTAQRHVAFTARKVASEAGRLNWKVRELIVQLALPRVSIRRHGTVADLMRDPDRFIEEFVTNQNGVRDYFLDALGLDPSFPGPSRMVWKREWPTRAAAGDKPLDEWIPASLRLVAEWRDSLPH